MFLWYAALALNLVASSITFAVPLSQNSPVALANQSFVPDNTPYPPGYGPSSCERSSGNILWSLSTVVPSAKYRSTIAVNSLPNVDSGTGNDGRIITSFRSPPNRTSLTSPNPQPKLCKEIFNVKFLDIPQRGTIRTPIIRIKEVDLCTYYFSWSLSSDAQGTAWMREVGQSGWRREVFYMYANDGIKHNEKISFQALGQVSFDVALRPTALGTTGEIAFFKLSGPPTTPSGVAEAVTENWNANPQDNSRQA